jgi:hypothetical protein
MTPLSDVKAYFRGKGWDGHWSGDSFEGSVSVVDVKIRPSGKSYSVRIESVDDPSDSDDVTTGEPLKAIADFLGQDIPGGEHFEKMSSFPSFFAHSIAMAAELVGAGMVGRRAAVRMLRRLSSFRPTADSPMSRPGTDLSDLERDAKKKGWKARLNKDGYGDDVLEIDVSGIYRAEVTLEAVMYDYKFELRGESGVDEKGTTDDPIRDFEKWATKPDVKEALERAQSAGRDQHTVQAPAEPTKRRAPQAPTRRAPAEEQSS